MGLTYVGKQRVAQALGPCTHTSQLQRNSWLLVGFGSSPGPGHSGRDLVYRSSCSASIPYSAALSNKSPAFKKWSTCIEGYEQSFRAEGQGLAGAAVPLAVGAMHEGKPQLTAFYSHLGAAPDHSSRTHLIPCPWKRRCMKYIGTHGTVV